MNPEKLTSYTLEHKFEIWNDKTGERIEIGPDRDGLDLIEIRNFSDDGQVGQSITMTKDEACLLRMAIDKLLGVTD